LELIFCKVCLPNVEQEYGEVNSSFADYLDLGKKIFKESSKPSKAPTFLAGDLFSDSLLNIDGRRLDTQPDVRKLTSLTPLLGHVRAIGASSLFHLFNEQQQYTLAKRLFALLDITKSGSMLLGSHVGLAAKGIRENRQGKLFRTDWGMFCHSPESWKELWFEIAGQHGKKVEVRTELIDLQSIWASKGGGKPKQGAGSETPVDFLLRWSVVIE
jgi:hypothetical protein